MVKNEIRTILTLNHERRNRESQIYRDAQFCGKPIFIGDSVVIRRMGCRHARTYHYHAECFDKLYVDC